MRNTGLGAPYVATSGPVASAAMADRPRGGGRPEEGSPEYDWLYGSGRSSGSGGEDATRAVPRRGEDPTRQVRPQDIAPTPDRRAAAPPPPPGRTRRSRWRRPRFRLRWLKLALLLWLVFLLAVPIWAWTRVTQVEAFPDDEGRPGDQPGKTYLVVGSDKADDLTEEQREQVRTGPREGRRTDTIMLLHVGDGPDLLLSIPRDSQVEIPGHGGNKINAAFAIGGPKLLVRTLEENTGIHIDDYIEIGFGGVINMVDAVGGIEICPAQAMRDPDARLDIEAGCQEADGTTALGYARSRKTYTARGDVDRAAAQREVVSAVGGKALSPWTIINPIRWYRVNTSAASSLTVSEGTGPIDMGRFAWAATRATGDSGLTCGVPIRDLAVNWDEERSSRMFQLIAEDNTSGIGRNLCTPSGLPR